MKLTKSDIRQKGGSEVSPRRLGGLTPCEFVARRVFVPFGAADEGI